MHYVRAGDTVVVWKLDQLGRNTLHILETVKVLADAGVTLISTTDGIDCVAFGHGIGWAGLEHTKDVGTAVGAIPCGALRRTRRVDGR